MLDTARPFNDGGFFFFFFEVLSISTIQPVTEVLKSISFSS